MHRFVSYLIVILLALMVVPSAYTAKAEANEDREKNPRSVEIKAKNYFKSHTSYDFGRPSKLNRLLPVSQLDWAYVEARSEQISHTITQGYMF